MLTGYNSIIKQTRIDSLLLLPRRNTTKSVSCQHRSRTSAMNNQTLPPVPQNIASLSVILASLMSSRIDLLTTQIISRTEQAPLYGLCTLSESNCFSSCISLQLIGTMFNWGLYGALSVQVCKWLVPTRRCTSLVVLTSPLDIYSQYFEDDKKWMKSLGMLHW